MPEIQGHELILFHHGDGECYLVSPQNGDEGPFLFVVQEDLVKMMIVP